jgi:hypothetical protein
MLTRLAFLNGLLVEPGHLLLGPAADAQGVEDLLQRVPRADEVSPQVEVDRLLRNRGPRGQAG